MKALLDTNIIIHRETNTIIRQDIGTLFRWLDKAGYTKCIHPLTVEELFKNSNKQTVATIKVKLDSYYQLKTTAPLSEDVSNISAIFDTTLNDKNDTKLLNEVCSGRVDILITEDKKIHKKANQLAVSEKVFSIDSFLEKVVSENPDLVNYKVLSVTKRHFGEIDLRDPFFDTFREDYHGFDQWFNRKADEIAYVTHNRGKILSFLYIKIEDKAENYSDITPVFSQKRRLKIGTFKVSSNGVRLGERFLKIIFDNAIQFKVEEIYVTIFNKREEQSKLIDLLEVWGFTRYGTKRTLTGDELVLVRNFRPHFYLDNPRASFPFISGQTTVFLCPIWPDYHTDLLPDSILTTESPLDFVENEPHRNAISKVYISRSWEKGLRCGDTIVFYRTGGKYKGVITTIGIVESVVIDIKSEEDFILKCRKRSVFRDEELKNWWNYKPHYRPFIVNFLYAYSFPHRINMDKLLQLGIIKDIESAPRGFEKITQEQFKTIVKETRSDESIIVC